MGHAQNIPLAEKITTATSAPLDILSSQPDGIFVPTFGEFQDELIVTFSGDTLTLISTETWAESTDQPETFPTTIADVALLGNGTSLIIGLSNGDIARIELDDTDTFLNTDEPPEDENDETTDSRVLTSSDDMSSAGITAIATDPDSSSETVYMINGSSGFVYAFNLETETLSEIQITDFLSDESDDLTSSTAVTLNDILFATSTSGDRVVLCSDDGRVFVSSTSSLSFSEDEALPPDDADETPTFSEMSLHPDGNHIFLVDSANSYVWVYSIPSGQFIDQVTGGDATDPIEISNNSSLEHITIFGSEDNDNVTAYVSGSSGVTALDANNPSEAEADKQIDADTTTPDDTDVIELSGTPGPLACSSSADGYIYSANGDATVSVITNNPFPTITDISPATVTEDSSSFTVTFESDETGNYTVRSNSDPTAEEGTLLQDTTSVDATDTDISFTLDINDFDRTTFSEGENLIFVFVENENGFIGRDAIALNIDRPPGEIPITAVDFGNTRLIITFTPSTDGDIARYILTASPAENQSDPDCPGSLTFSEEGSVASEIEGSVCEDENGETLSSCQAQIPNLTNGTWYCVAAQAEDESDQLGTLTTSSLVMRPELTVGPAGFLGETGCSLNKNKETPHSELILILSPLVFLFLKRIGKKRFQSISYLVCIFFILSPSSAWADSPEKNDSHDFTFELKTGNWIPTDSGMKSFFNACCQIPIEAEFGVIFKDRYNVTLTTGFMTKSGPAVGGISGNNSFDRFRLSSIPIRLDFIYRFNFHAEQTFEPYLRAGLDFVLFRETTAGNNIDGVKIGGHAAAGLGIQLMNLDNTKIEHDFSVESVQLVLEGRYSHINSFKSSGIDFSGVTPYLGILFQF